MNLNKVFLIGRLTADPQLRTTPTGFAVASFSIATNRNWIDKSGARQEDAQFHNVVVWGRQAEVANQFLKKGSSVFIEGRLQTRAWQDKQGQPRKTTEIVCERMQLGPRPGGGVTPQTANTFQNSAQSSDLSARTEKDPKVEEQLPEINLEEEGEVKAEDLPF